MVRSWAINVEIDQYRHKKQLIDVYDVLDILLNSQLVSPRATEMKQKCR
jgi:hypothetical protein